MTYQEIVNRLTPIYGIGEARAIIRLVLEERFDLSLTDIMLGKVNELSSNDTTELEKIILRLENNEPVQYILGYQDFCDHRFHVAPGVLIPRPETELLVEQAQQSLSDSGSLSNRRERGMRLIDIGTGSGCIAISLALANPALKVEAWDISDDALRIAEGNAESLGADNVIFKKVDILALNYSLFNNNYSLIISNPPYICRHEAEDMERNVLDYEPDTALFVPDDDPLLFYRAIAEFGTKALLPNGRLLFEINRAYGQEVCALLSDLGYLDINLIKDQFDNDRIVSARKT